MKTTQTELQKVINGVGTFSKIFNKAYNSQKTLTECLLISNKIKALLSLNGNKVEIAAASYILLNKRPTDNMLVLFLANSAMAWAKVHRLGFKKAVCVDLAIDIGLFLVYYEELAKPGVDFETLMEEFANE